MAKGQYSEWLADDGLLQLRAWARDGLRDEDIAQKMGIARGTLYAWKKKYSDIDDALKKGKEPVDIEVENSLLKRALGYTYDEVTREPLYNMISGEPIKDEHGEPVVAVTKIVTKEVRPDTTAQIFWLKNRKPEAWRDRQDIGITGGAIPVVISGEDALEE